MTVADRIKHLRERLGMTQEELAEKLGYTGKSSISKIETSGDNVTLKKISRLAPVLHTSVEYLMGWTNDPRPSATPCDSDNPITSTSGKVYYFDDEAAEMAQELFENEGGRILMKASKGLKTEDMIALAEIAKRMRSTNPEG